MSVESSSNRVLPSIDSTRLKLILARSPAVLYSCQPDGDYGATFVSENVREQLGYAPSDFTEESGFWASKIHPDDQARVFAELSKPFVDDKAVYEYRFLHGDGSYRWMRDELRWVKDAAGAPVEIIGSWHDVTAEKDAETIVWERKKHLKEAQRIASVGSWEWDIASGALSWSDQVYRIFGHSPGEIEPSYELFWSYLFAEDREKVELALQGALAGEGDYSIEHRIVTADGHLRYVHGRAEVTFSTDKVPLRMSGTLHDITKRKAFEAELRSTQETNQALIEVVPDALFLLDREGLVVEANTIASKKLGIDLDRLVGSCIFDLMPREVVAKRKKFLDLVFATRRRSQFVDQYADLWFENFLVPIKNEQGQVEHVAVASRDITLMRQNEQQLLDYQEQLREMAAALLLLEEGKRRELSRALHDNVGPLLALAKVQLGQLLNQNGASNQKQQIEGIISLIADGIEVTRSLTTTLSPPFLSSLPFSASLRWLEENLLAVNGIEGVIHEQGVPVAIPDNCSLRLFTIVRELLLNIVKHAEARKVEIDLQWAAEELLLKVCDNGIGFDVEKQQLQALERRSYGLFSVREQLSYLNAELQIDSVLSQGTCAAIRVPFNGKCR